MTPSEMMTPGPYTVVRAGLISYNGLLGGNIAITIALLCCHSLGDIEMVLAQAGGVGAEKLRERGIRLINAAG